MIIFEVGGVAEKTAVKPCWRMQGCGEKRPLITVGESDVVGRNGRYPPFIPLFVIHHLSSKTAVKHG